MRIARARPALIRGMLVAASRERERRQAAEQVKVAEAVDKLLAELQQMGARWLAVRVPGRSLRDDMELAEQIAAAPDWARVDELREAPDLSPMEAVAAAMTVDPTAAMRLLGQYLDAR